MFGSLVDIDQQTKDFSILTEAIIKVKNTWVYEIQNVIHLKFENRLLYLDIHPQLNHYNATPNSRPQTQPFSGKTQRLNNSPEKRNTKSSDTRAQYQSIGRRPILLQANVLSGGKTRSNGVLSPRHKMQIISSIPGQIPPYPRKPIGPCTENRKKQ